MSEADDVLHAIDQLRRDLSGYHGQLKAHNDLQRHCDNQRKRICDLEGLYAKAKAEIAELREQTRWMAQTDSQWEAAVRDLEQARSENAKLKEELEQWRRLTAGIELPEYPVTQFQPKDLERENAKLRELNSLDRLRKAMGCNTIRDDHNGGIIYQRVHLDKALFDRLCDDVEAEITKLRELVRDMYWDLVAEMPESLLEDRLAQMRELGVDR